MVVKGCSTLVPLVHAHVPNLHDNNQFLNLHELESGSAALSHFEPEQDMSRPWIPHTCGQDDGSLHKLPQIILFSILFIVVLSLSPRLLTYVW